MDHGFSSWSDGSTAFRPVQGQKYHGREKLFTSWVPENREKEREGREGRERKNEPDRKGPAQAITPQDILLRGLLPPTTPL